MNSFPMSLLTLTLWWRGRLSYRNQSIDLLRKSMDWFLCDNSLRHERVKKVCFLCLFNADFKHTLALLSASHSLALLSASHSNLKYPEIKSIQSYQWRWQNAACAFLLHLKKLISSPTPLSLNLTGIFTVDIFIMIALWFWCGNLIYHLWNLWQSPCLIQLPFCLSQYWLDNKSK